MLKNYITIAWRNLKKNKVYSIINTVGLSVGLTCCILVGLFVFHELSYESHHKKAERIYKIETKIKVGDNVLWASNSSTALRHTVVKQLASVQMATGLMDINNNLLKTEKLTARISGAYHATPSVLDIFTITFTKGNPGTALKAPNTAIISERIVHKFFGDKNPIGKIIKVGERLALEITGVFENLPDNTILNFNLIASSQNEAFYDWASDFSATNYLLVKPNTNIKALEKKLLTITKSHKDMPFLQGYKLTRLDHIYLPPLVSGSPDLRYIYIFSLIALLLLLIACINHINLSVAQILPRYRNVGIRKVLGAKRKQVLLQFLTESFLITFMALIIAVMLVELLQPILNSLAGIALTPFNIASFKLWGVLILSAALIAIISGAYISFYISKLSPANIFRENYSQKTGKSLLKKGLIIFQFTVSIALICSTFIIQNQLEFIQESDLGFNTKQIVVIKTFSDAVQSKNKILQNEISSLTGVEAVTSTNAIPGYDGYFSIALAEEMPLDKLAMATVDKNYFEIMGISTLSRQNQNLNEGDYIVNKAAADLFGVKTAKGQKVTIFQNTEVNITAVTENYHFESLRTEIRPLMVKISSEPLSLLAVQLTPGNINRTIESIEKSWSDITGAVPFNYSFLENEIDKMYQAEQRFARLFGGFSLITIIIACMGLFGLSAFAARKRTKEIGIRKVLGATVTNIVGLLSKDFLKLVLIGFVIAVPVALYFMSQWLQNFAYRIDLGAGIFLLAGGVALFIALATVSWQSVRAALANPTDSLRSE